jgi:diamine N-acetyltransferase
MLLFRTASFYDIETIRQLAQKIWHEAYAEMLSSDQITYMLNLMYSHKTIEKELHEGVIWEIIQEGETPVGFISTTLEGTTLKLNKLYIYPAHHGKGIGQQSLDHVKQVAREKGLKSFYLTVNKRNSKAIKAYEKAGMSRTDSKVFDIGGGYVMDDYIYTSML